ncbi:MAG: ATP phosphoribosyltransferase [Rhizobiales bacterium]|nr:ATP phosphoribosyltransferase [Hyphomicrobiales bacterium]
MDDPLVLGVPSKGRLMERTLALFEAAGLAITKNGNERGYLGSMPGLDNVVVRFLSASEIASMLKRGRIHVGVTGEDLIREQIAEPEGRVDFLRPLGFGHADVVVAVPAFWIDVVSVSDLQRVGLAFQAMHGRRMRVATKYLNLARRFFTDHAVTNYRLVESLGATEGTPAAGSAEIVIDITSTGATLAANALKVLEDGVILRSEANLVSSRAANWSTPVNVALNAMIERIGA